MGMFVSRIDNVGAEGTHQAVQNVKDVGAYTDVRPAVKLVDVNIYRPLVRSVDTHRTLKRV